MSSLLPWPFTIYTDPGDPFIPEDESSPTIERHVSSLLRNYETPGVQPPSSRMDTKAIQQESEPIRVWHIWKYWAAAASKGTQMTYDFISHHIWGPRRKSWGVEMTLITSFMRDGAQHSKLADIATLRLLIGICGLVPLAHDAIITPVTFTVRRRRLEGFLADFDAAETGKRQLSGEWIVGKRLWQKRQAEWRASRAAKSAAQNGNDARPPKPTTRERVVLYLHGGAYFVFSAATHRLITIQLSKMVGARVFALNYRLAPETRFPGPLHDAVIAYFRLIEDLHIPPENILVAGDSAGGGLSLALLMYLRDNKYPLPSGAILFCPWVDLTMSCDSWDSNAAYDVISIPPPTDHLNPVACYLGQNTEKYLTHPYASPLFGNFKGLPPMLIQYGDAEVLRDEITLLVHKAKKAGVEVRDELYEDAVHVFHTFPFLQATHDAFESCRAFVRVTLPQHQARSPKILDEVAQSELEQEMDNAQSRFVGGDGAEVADDMKKVVEETGEQVEKAQQDDSSTALRRDGSMLPSEASDQESDDPGPSWRPVTAADKVPQLPPDGRAEDEGQAAVANAAAGAGKPLRRIRSALHSIASKAKTTVRPRHHRRATSYYRVRFGEEEDDVSGEGRDDGHDGSAPPSIFAFGRTSQGHSRATSISSNSPPSSSSQHTTLMMPPAPHIRAKHRASSHPDISSLCMTWTSTSNVHASQPN